MAAYSKIRCPNPEHDDSNPSCAVYDDGGAFCFSRCGYIAQDQLKEWIGDNYASVVEEAKRTVSITNTHRGPSRDEGYRFCLLSSATLLTGPRQARKEWFYSRGFSEYSVQRFKFGHTGADFVIPLWYKGEFHGYKLRKDDLYADPDDVKYLIPKGQKSAVVRPNPTGSPTVIVEGELDAYLLSQWGMDAVTGSTGAGNLSDLLRSEKDLAHKRVFLLLDMDGVGEQTALHMENTIRNAVRLSLPSGKDITEYLCTVDEDRRGAALRNLFQRGY